MASASSSLAPAEPVVDPAGTGNLKQTEDTMRSRQHLLQRPQRAYSPFPRPSRSDDQRWVLRSSWRRRYLRGNLTGSRYAGVRDRTAHQPSAGGVRYPAHFTEATTEPSTERSMETAELPLY